MSLVGLDPFALAFVRLDRLEKEDVENAAACVEESVYRVRTDMNTDHYVIVHARVSIGL